MGSLLDFLLPGRKHQERLDQSQQSSEQRLEELREQSRRLRLAVRELEDRRHNERDG